MLKDPFIHLFIFIIIYLLVLFLFRILNIGKKKEYKNCSNACPDCKNPLQRIRRLTYDKIIYYLTIKIFELKRYVCENCGWEGLRWEKNKKKIRK